MPQKITLQNGSTITGYSTATKRACSECVNFVASVITPGRGLCRLYSEIVGQVDSCRRGFEAKADRVRGQNGPIAYLEDDCEEAQS